MEKVQDLHNIKSLQTIGDYLYDKQKVLGQGAFAVVYKGFSKKNKDMEVAVKVVNLNKISKEDIDNEVLIMKKMNSPYIATLYAAMINRQENKYYLILEYCNQGCLTEQNKKFDVEKSKEVFGQIVEGFKYLYENNVMHRDIKMDNILMHNNTVKIADFGLAKIMKKNQLEVASKQCGTPATMAPEQYLHFHNKPNEQLKFNYTKNQDVFSLGVVFHELIYKVHAFGLSSEKLVTLERIPIKNKVPEAEQILDKILAFESKRISMEELFQDPYVKTLMPSYKMDTQMNNNLSDLKNWKNNLKIPLTVLKNRKKSLTQIQEENENEINIQNNQKIKGLKNNNQNNNQKQNNNQVQDVNNKQQQIQQLQQNIVQNTDKSWIRFIPQILIIVSLLGYILINPQNYI